MSQMVPMPTDKGINPTLAVALLSVLSLSSIVARLIVGYLLDRVFASFVGATIFAASRVRPG
ncbi:putative major facilitator superfamily transporter [Gordonia polyisoprenivorans NBRC 16320 = JCM 10675]|uniref:MFS transporter n=1 Tax=Gordonia polyisoprenivorans TaxID=84595 RepID=A0A846WKZ1_9ACTN|nr:MFS transporter [Gordonia polyisoprenivorans]OZC29505.1 MFS transporter [Gordonia polyisoprenivorans]GAB26361.1 putative major facilitator superfamily transporter [Gordonia polyisoprenivorans NBRC 16320 = JCM 10675]